MTTSSTVSVVVLKQFIDSYRKMGGKYDLERALRSYNLPKNFFEDESNRIPIAIMYESISAFSKRFGPVAGLRLARDLDLTQWRWFDDLFQNGRNIREALESFIRYLHIYTELGTFELAHTTSNARIIFNPTDPEHISYHQVDGVMQLLLQFARLLGGEGLLALHLKHSCPDGYEAEYADSFNMAVIFNAEESFFEVDPSWLSQDLAQNWTPSYRKLGAAEIRLSKVKRERDIGDQVVFILRKMLSTGDVSIKVVAQSLGMSQRTLQRRLKEQGLVYQDVLDVTRKELATEYLLNTDHYVSEIAFMVGYSDIRYFFRAFKRWTGLSPGQYRETHTQTLESLAV